MLHFTRFSWVKLRILGFLPTCETFHKFHVCTLAHIFYRLMVKEQSKAICGKSWDLGRLIFALLSNLYLRIDSHSQAGFCLTGWTPFSIIKHYGDNAGM